MTKGVILRRVMPLIDKLRNKYCCSYRVGDCAGTNKLGGAEFLTRESCKSHNAGL